MEALKDIIIPPVCPVCSKPCTEPLCTDCRQKIEVIGRDICPRCGKQLGGPVCTYCRQNTLYYYQARSFAYYSKAIKTLLFRYKEQKIYSLAGLLSRFLEACFNSHYHMQHIDCMDGMPDGHIQRLCAHLESRLKIPYANNFKKIGPAGKQKFLGAQERRYNPIGAYKVADCLGFAGKNLLLVDDVFTTGSSLNHMAKLAKDAGADRIYLLTIARGA
ncbi:MAG: double zinc ribbon domain-containing protein [Actinomycetota bacterium]